MNRTIKFRGKSVKDDEWISSDKFWTNAHLWNINDVPVQPDTVGQSTGLHDKNGKEMYEGDIVKFHYMKSLPYSSELTPSPVSFGKIASNRYNQFAIFSNGLEMHIDNAMKYGEIVGNIYDNPDLLKGNYKELLT